MNAHEDDLLTRKRDWVYPADVAGTFQRVHRWTGVVLIAFLFAMPWLRVGGRPIFLIDIPGRSFYALGAVFRATDTIFLVLIGLMAAVGLFLFTALYGRVWCGFACPQTVFLEEWIRPLERWLEGPRAVRQKRDAGPWTFDKAWRKAAKWSVFAVVSFALAMTLVSWFNEARELWTFGAPGYAYAFVGVFTVALYADFAWFREQFCSYLCPYARFQGALADDESLVVSYDRKVAEPRAVAKLRKQPPPEVEPGVRLPSWGACIDCTKCVAVCPAGIDIRDGYQLECISCARCVDACTEVMAKKDQPTLVRWSTTADDEGREARRWRPRTVVYAAVLAVLAVAFLVLLGGRHELDVNVSRLAGTLYQVDTDGRLRNTFLLELVNLHPDRELAVQVEVVGLEGAEVIVDSPRLAPLEARTLPLVVRAPPGVPLDRTVPLTVRVTTADDEVEVQASFKTTGREG